MDPIFNSKLEQSLLRHLNAYRDHYGRPALTLHPELDKFAHDNATWSENITNKVDAENSAHAYFTQNGSSLFQKGFSKIGENATIIQYGYNININNVLSSSITTKDTVNAVGPIMNINYLNQIRSNIKSIDSLAYSLIYIFGDDNQPIGYDGTTAATQGTAHKQSLLSNNWKSVGFGVGISRDGNVHIWIDLAA
ncbi:CAP domain-containing protein (plasmid) [Lactococcus lactis subsp. lactis]|nr:CAP domain-containing protein [Lactococcus lactis]WKB49930.1 CAP domain-containing protein [Lactococcus lactis subsp. lactis]